MIDKLLRGGDQPVWVWMAVAGLGVAGAVGSAYLTIDAVAASAESTQSLDSVVAAPPAEPDEPSTTVASETSTTTTEPPLPDNQSSQEEEPQPDPDCPPLFQIQFAVGSAELLPEGFEPQADSLVEWMLLHPDAALVVEGHADSTGSEEANLALSYRRAESVATEMAARGLSEDRMNSRGLGEYQAMVGEPSDSERNRRITMRVPGYEGCPIESLGDGGP